MASSDRLVKTPRIVIQYCTKCKWTNRAIWYTQELFQTFADPAVDIAEIALQPIVDKPGTFQVLLQVDDEVTTVFRRKFKKSQNQSYNAGTGGGDGDGDGDGSDEYDGFPDAKFLKALVKEKLNKMKQRQMGADQSQEVKVGDHLSGKGSLLNEGGVKLAGDADDNACAACKKEGA
ncbi:uncharacterized protein LODBEIA_P52180 [Lodderomyces beijingensis]|uniref:Uncharacterized protein n=1 Tax=Lodderomyces beijingensis TaxID=1775926 RepID=A0ABP0ZS77_9ASCO